MLFVVFVLPALLRLFLFFSLFFYINLRFACLASFAPLILVFILYMYPSNCLLNSFRAFPSVLLFPIYAVVMPALLLASLVLVFCIYRRVACLDFYVSSLQVYLSVHKVNFISESFEVFKTYPIQLNLPYLFCVSRP